MASFITDRILDLQALAVMWALEPPSEAKTMFGFWLHGELASIYETGLLKDSDLVDFNATVSIMLDKILPQPYDGEDE
jgi:hypothetical protein